MKKLSLFLFLLFFGCCNDDEIKPNPCCVLVYDPFTHNSTVNGITTYTTYFNGIHQCDTLVVQMHHITTNPNEIPKDGECFKE